MSESFLELASTYKNLFDCVHVDSVGKSVSSVVFEVGILEEIV